MKLVLFLFFLITLRSFHSERRLVNYSSSGLQSLVYDTKFIPPSLKRKRNMISFRTSHHQQSKLQFVKRMIKVHHKNLTVFFLCKMPMFFDAWCQESLSTRTTDACCFLKKKHEIPLLFWILCAFLCAFAITMVFECCIFILMVRIFHY